MAPVTLSLPAIGQRPRYLLLVLALLGLGAIAAAAPSGCENLECTGLQADCVPQRP